MKEKERTVREFDEHVLVQQHQNRPPNIDVEEQEDQPMMDSTESTPGAVSPWCVSVVQFVTSKYNSVY